MKICDIIKKQKNILYKSSLYNKIYMVYMYNQMKWILFGKCSHIQLHRGELVEIKGIPLSVAMLSNLPKVECNVKHGLITTSVP